MSKEIAKLFASMMIARSDIKAIQRSNGDYNPVESKFTMDDLLNHLSGNVTYGHYLLNKDNRCKMFAFDIDLEKPENDAAGNITREILVPTSRDSDGVWQDFKPGNPREIWLDRANVLQRTYLKQRLRSISEKIARTIWEQFEGDVPVAVAYTGSKGVHVYGFTGLMSASDVREGARIVLDSLNCFSTYRGENFFRHEVVDGDPEASYEGLSIEVFPKQSTLTGKSHGNLLRLPLGRNLKNPKDPTFFLDLRSDHGDGAFTPRDPVNALTTHDQWK